MKANIKNYNKPTPKALKQLGDLALAMIPTIQLSVAAAPEGTFTATQSWAIGAASSIILVLFKFATKMFAEEDTTFTEQEEPIK
jgi:hypothetical protein